MARRTDTDKAIRNIMMWADRPEWSDERDAVFDAHLTPVCERIGITPGELAEELADHGYDAMLFGIMFEDFLSRRFEPDDENMIDDYLKRRGWRESVPGRRYLQELRDSVLSLYEVTAVSPGRHCDLRDLVRGGKTIRVYEHMDTQNLVRWDRIAARVLNVNGKHVFSGGILPFRHEAAQRLLETLVKSRKEFNKRLSRTAGKEAAAEISSSIDLDELFLRGACTAFTSIWLIYTLRRLRQPLPELMNRDGEVLVFAETRFPFLAEQLDEIAGRLDAAPEWERETPDASTWIWLPDPGDARRKPESGLAFDSLRGGQRPIYGTLDLEPGVLTLTTNSMERTERAKHVLETLLHGLIGPALSKLQTPEEAMAEEDIDQRVHYEEEPADSIDPEIAAQMIHDMLDRHYRRCLDEPIPALNNKTPRQCARSKKGRAKVIDWLKHLENSELRRAADQGQEPYDSSWIWEELKLTKYRD